MFVCERESLVSLVDVTVVYPFRSDGVSVLTTSDTPTEVTVGDPTPRMICLGSCVGFCFEDGLTGVGIKRVSKFTGQIVTDRLF